MNSSLIRTFAILLLLTAASPAAGSDDPPQPGQVFPYWSSTESARSHRPEGEYETRSYYRFVRIADIDIPLASVTYMKQPVRKNLAPSIYDPKAVAEQARVAFGFPQWKSVTKYRGAYIYTADWPKVNKIVRIVLRKDGNQFIYSMALIRAGYSDAAERESEILQKKIAGVDSGSPSWVDRLVCWLEPLWMPAAVASEPSGAPGSSANSSAPMPPQGQPTGEVEAGFEGPGLWDRAKSVGSGLADDYSNRTARNNMIDNTANSLLPTFAGIMGSFFGNVAIEGLGVLAKLAIDAIIKAMPLSDHDLFDTFQTAKKEYEKTYGRIAELERQVPIALHLLQSIKEAGGRDALMVKYAGFLTDAKAEIASDEHKIEQLPVSPDTIGARCDLSRTVAKLKVVSDLVTAYNDILKRDSAVPEADELRSMCGEFLARVAELIDAEASLQTIRPKLIASQRGYSAALYQRYNTARGAASQVAKNRLRDEPREKADIQSTSCQQPMEPIYADKRAQDVMEACVKREKKAHPIASYFPFYGYFYVKNTLRPRCKSKVGDNEDQLPADLEAKKLAVDKQCSEALAKSKLYYDQLSLLSQDGGLAPDVQVLNASIDEYRNWILRLGQEQKKSDDEKTVAVLRNELAEAQKLDCQVADDRAILAERESSGN